MCPSFSAACIHACCPGDPLASDPAPAPPLPAPAPAALRRLSALCASQGVSYAEARTDALRALCAAVPQAAAHDLEPPGTWDAQDAEVLELLGVDLSVSAGGSSWSGVEAAGEEGAEGGGGGGGGRGGGGGEELPRAAAAAAAAQPGAGEA